MLGSNFHVIKELSREEEDENSYSARRENVEVMDEGTLTKHQFGSIGSVKQLKHKKKRESVVVGTFVPLRTHEDTLEDTTRFSFGKNQQQIPVSFQKEGKEVFGFLDFPQIKFHGH